MAPYWSPDPLLRIWVKKSLGDIEKKKEWETPRFELVVVFIGECLMVATHTRKVLKATAMPVLVWSWGGEKGRGEFSARFLRLCRTLVATPQARPGKHLGTARQR